MFIKLILEIVVYIRKTLFSVQLFSSPCFMFD